MSIYGLPPSLEEVLAGMGVRPQAPAMPPAPPMVGMPEPPPANPTFGLSPEDLAILGPDPAQGPEFEPQTMRVNPIERVLMALGQGVAGTPVPYPRNFGQGLATGFVRGLGGAGMGVAAAQDRFAKREEARRLAFDEQRRVATKEYRDRAFEILKENRKAAKAVAADERIVTAEDVRLFPTLEPMLGKPVSKRVYENVQNKALLPESAAERRAARAAELAEATARRQADAAERQQRLDKAKGINDLAADYGRDKVISRYMTLDNGLSEAEVAAAQANGIGDHSLIFAYMRAIEPQNPNAVKEGEFNTASKAVGAVQDVFLKATLKRYMTGDLLLPEGREIILNIMRDKRDDAREDFDLANKQYRNRALLFGEQNPEEFFLRQQNPRDPKRMDRGKRNAVDGATTPVRQ